MSGWRNGLAALAVLGGLAALVAVPAAVDSTLPDEGPLPRGEFLEIGYGVSLRPPSGARLVLGPSRPGAGEIELRSGGLTLRLTAVEVRGSADAFRGHARHKFTRDDELTPGPPQQVRTAAGVTGERGTLTPAAGGRRGCYAMFVAESAGLTAVVRPVADCESVPPDLWSAVASVRFEPAETW